MLTIFLSSCLQFGATSRALEGLLMLSAQSKQSRCPGCMARLAVLYLHLPDQRSANLGKKLTITASGALNDE